jgi:hypothetical protein
VAGGLLKVGTLGLLGGLAKQSESQAYTGYRGLDADLSAEQSREVADIEQRRDLAESQLSAKITSLVGKISKAESLGDFETTIPSAPSGITDDSALQLFRNPVALARLVLSLKKLQGAEEGRTCARMLLRCAELCPSGTVYDRYRQTYLCGAALCMTQAAVAVASSSRTGYSNSRTERSADAVTLWDMAANSRADELDPECKCNRARALALDGRYTDASEAMGSVAKGYTQDAAFALQYSKVLSLSGDVSNSLEWIRTCLRLDSSHLGDIRSCKDYKRVRKEMPEGFEEATTVRFRWRSSLGYTWDAVYLTNESPFRITDVKLEVLIGGASGWWMKDLTVDALEPGATQTWNLGFHGISVRDDDTKAQSATLLCRQNK